MAEPSLKFLFDSPSPPFFLSPDFPLEDDGVRSTSNQWRDEIHDMFLQEIEAGKVNVIPLKGSITERVFQIYDAMEIQ